MGNQKTFIFLYPQQEIFDHEISTHSFLYKSPKLSEECTNFMHRFEIAKTQQEKEKIRAEWRKLEADSFKPFYSAKLNSCIYHRYRRNGFSIVYALLDDSSVADIIQLHPNDRVIYVGMDSKTHRTKGVDGQYPYPNQDYILDQLLPVKTLRVSGFHMWDCVEKLARRAHEGGIEVLVDEDLTEFFAGRLNDRAFRIKKYPSYNPRKHQKSMLDLFMDARKNKPWLWQEY